MVVSSVNKIHFKIVDALHKSLKYIYISERSSKIKYWSCTSQPTETHGWVCGIHHLGRQPTLRSVMLFGVVDILFSCTPRLITSETLVHHD